MTDIRTIAPEQLATMSLEDACKAIQALYTPEEWKRMAHTTAVTLSAEEILEAAYEQAKTEQSILFALKNMGTYEGEIPSLAELVEAKKAEMQAPTGAHQYCWDCGSETDGSTICPACWQKLQQERRKQS